MNQEEVSQRGRGGVMGRGRGSILLKVSLQGHTRVCRHTHTQTHLWEASDGTVESSSVPSHNHPVRQRRQELGRCAEVVFLVIKRFVGDTWGRGDEPVRQLILIVPKHLSSVTRYHRL